MGFKDEDDHIYEVSDDSDESEREDSEEETNVKKSEASIDWLTDLTRIYIGQYEKGDAVKEKVITDQLNTINIEYTNNKKKYKYTNLIKDLYRKGFIRLDNKSLLTFLYKMFQKERKEYNDFRTSHRNLKPEFTISQPYLNKLPPPTKPIKNFRPIGIDNKDNVNKSQSQQQQQKSIFAVQPPLPYTLQSYDIKYIRERKIQIALEEKEEKAEKELELQKQKKKEEEAEKNKKKEEREKKRKRKSSEREEKEAKLKLTDAPPTTTITNTATASANSAATATTTSSSILPDTTTTTIQPPIATTATPTVSLEREFLQPLKVDNDPIDYSELENLNNPMMKGDERIVTMPVGTPIPMSVMQKTLPPVGETVPTTLQHNNHSFSLDSKLLEALVPVEKEVIATAATPTPTSNIIQTQPINDRISPSNQQNSISTMKPMIPPISPHSTMQQPMQQPIQQQQQQPVQQSMQQQKQPTNNNDVIQSLIKIASNPVIVDQVKQLYENQVFKEQELIAQRMELIKLQNERKQAKLQSYVQELVNCGNDLKLKDEVTKKLAVQAKLIQDEAQTELESFSRYIVDEMGKYTTVQQITLQQLGVIGFFQTTDIDQIQQQLKIVESLFPNIRKV